MPESTAASRRVDIVAIHGVGDRAPGAVLDGVILGLSKHGEIHVEESSMYLHGHRFPYAEVRRHPFVSSVMEVNWDDISHPARPGFEYITHFLAVLASTLRLADYPMGDRAQNSWLNRVYAWAFKSLLLWCVFLPVVTIASFAPTGFAQSVWIAGAVGVVLLLARLSAPQDEDFRAGYVWAAGVAWVGVAGIAGWKHEALAAATSIYGAAQGFAGVALIAAMAASWRRGRQARMEQRLARLGFLYLPFALLSGVGALVWAATLFLANHLLAGGTLSVWSRVYVRCLSYDLAFAEALLAAAVVLGGLLLLSPAIPLVMDKRSGARVHAWLVVALKAFPLIVLAVYVLYVAHFPLFVQDRPYGAFHAWIYPWFGPALSRVGIALPRDPDVFAIYVASSLRLLPFLAYFVGPFRTALDTISDVLLYLDPTGHLGGEKIRAGTQRRLRDALSLVESNNQSRTIVVVGHSQGTAIAADVLATQCPGADYRLVTLGSPISSLYWRFMGEQSVAAPKIPWCNLFRSGDYIAGGVGLKSAWAPKTGVDDNSLGEGSHPRYFRDPRVWDDVGKWLASTPPPTAPF